MRSAKLIAISSVLAGLLAAGSTGVSGAPEQTGKEIIFDRSKGNCLACHDMPKVPGVELPGNIGPVLADIKSRYPDKAVLRAKIWDAARSNPETAMPPFGRNKILTEQEIDKVTDFIYGL